MDRSSDFFKGTEGVTRSLASLTAALRSLSRGINGSAGLEARRLSRAVAGVSAHVVRLQRRAGALTAESALATWLRAETPTDRVTRFALVSFRQIAVSSMARHSGFRDALAVSPALTERFEAARAMLVESLDQSVVTLRDLVSWCDSVAAGAAATAESLHAPPLHRV